MSTKRKVYCADFKAIGKQVRDKEVLINRGSTTAKNGFKNEDFTVVQGSYKADIQVEIKIEIKLKRLTDIQSKAYRRSV